MPRSAKKRPIPAMRRPAGLVALSRREVGILCHMREGSTDKEIARLLGLSERTVEHHVQSVCQKLAVANRTQAVVVALRRQLIPLH